MREFFAGSGTSTVLRTGIGEYLVTAEIHYPVWSVVLLALVVLGTVAAVIKLRDRDHD